jgi:alcohol dehydrogenase class IV
MRFEFATATRVIFGPGTVAEVGPLARELGPRALVVTGSDLRRAEPLLAALREESVAADMFSITGEPTVQAVEQGVAMARRQGAGVIIGFGGGSAIDTGKAVAAMLANPGELLDYLEVIGRGKALTQPSAPFIAIPTTAGTGSEVTRNAVLASPEHRVKVSLRSALMLPRVAVVDPELMLELPPPVTASTGLDALTQLIEPYVSSRANPMTDALCVEGMRRAARSLRRACAPGRDLEARTDMALAGLFGGFALANAGLGAVHGFAGPLGGEFPAPHGAVCAALLPHVMQANLQALRQRGTAPDTLRRYDEIGRLLTGRPEASAEDGIAWVRQLVADLRIPPLSRYGVQPEHVDGLVAKAGQASSMKANAIALTPAELREILQQAL